MKLAAVCILLAGLLCNSMMAIAEGPVPFRALMQAAGTPGVDTQNNSLVSGTKPAAHHPMTTGGKVITGVGIGLAALGGVFLACGAASSHNDFIDMRGPCLATGAGFAGAGITLIVLGVHWRTTK